MAEGDRLTRLREALSPRYVVEEPLGSGGMADVYLAREPKHDRAVAIKVLKPGIAVDRGPSRFLREIKITAGLRHPHILPLLDSGQVEDGPFYVMPYVEGESLQQRLARETQLPLLDALRIAREVADALAEAHARGIVHRDIKPGNVLLDAGHAVVADFGIARAIAVSGADGITKPGAAIGTAPYLSPEQATGEEYVDGRSDIYSLGCVLYEMLVGEPPFTGPTEAAVIAKHLGVPAPDAATTRPSIPPEVDAILKRTLSKIPADRYQEAAALRSDLDAVLRSAGRRRDPKRDRRRGKGTVWERWSHIVKGGMVGAVSALAVVLGVSWWSNRVELDPNRIVVFPARNSAPGVTPPEAGTDVATIVGYALEGTEPLRWIDGTTELTPEQLGDPSALTTEVKRDVARRLAAGFYVDGNLLAGGDSISVVLRLNDVEGDSVVAQGRAGAPIGSFAVGPAGLAAAGQLLPDLVGTMPTDRWDVLSERDPAAIANWLLGERAYRNSEIERSLEYFERATERDSLLVLAALGAARAAGWKARIPQAQRSVRAALRHEELLPPRQARFAVALSDYLDGNADSALVRLGAILVEEPTSGDAWMLLGEVVNHLLPDPSLVVEIAGRVMTAAMEVDPQATSPELQRVEAALRAGAVVTGTVVEEAAMSMAVAVDSTFTPPLVHLTEIAVRRGDVEQAGRFVDRWRSVDPDSSLMARVDLEIRCVRDGPGSVDWEEAVAAAPLVVLQAGVILSKGMAQPGCAERAFDAVLRSPGSSISEQWGGLLGQVGVLFAQGRWEELRDLLTSSRAAPLAGPSLFQLAWSAGGPFEEEAGRAASDTRRSLPETPSPSLWLRALWASEARDDVLMGELERVLTARAAEGGRTDALLRRVVGARRLAIVGDPNEAIAELQRLRPDGTRGGLTWNPWESLGAERLLLAERLLDAGRYREAISAASWLDRTEPVIHLVYLASSLGLRLRAAEAIGDADLAAELRERLKDLHVPGPYTSSGVETRISEEE